MTRRTFGQIAAGVAAGLVAGVTPFLMRLWRAPRMWTIGPGDGWPADFRDGDSITVLHGAVATIPPDAIVNTAILRGQLDHIKCCSWDRRGRPAELRTSCNTWTPKQIRECFLGTEWILKT